MPKRSKLEQQQALTFQYAENLRGIVEDLEHIDSLIPAETSRHGCIFKDINKAAVIEDRKRHLLSYIQTICRDHILWSKKLLDGGWGNGAARKREK